MDSKLPIEIYPLFFMLYGPNVGTGLILFSLQFGGLAIGAILCLFAIAFAFEADLRKKAGPLALGSLLASVVSGMAMVLLGGFSLLLVGAVTLIALSSFFVMRHVAKHKTNKGEK
jgi:hypothetical protein